MVDLSQPATAAEFVSAGADAATAAALAHQANVMAGRGTPDDRMALAMELANAPPAAKDAPSSPVSAAEATAALEAHQAAEASAHFEQTFAAPVSPTDYRFPYLNAEPTDEQAAADSAVKTALHEARVPTFIVGSIASDLAEATSKLANETPQALQTRLQSRDASLQRMWGKDYVANVDKVNAFMDVLTRDPALARLNDDMRYMSAISVDSILQFALHGKR